MSVGPGFWWGFVVGVWFAITVALTMAFLLVSK